MPREVLQIGFLVIVMLLLFGVAVTLSVAVYLALASLVGRRLKHARRTQTRRIDE